jgi:hypothetical protein
MTADERLHAQFESFRAPSACSGAPTEWRTDAAVVHICFLQDGRMLDKVFYPAQRLPEPPVERLRRWLHLCASQEPH